MNKKKPKCTICNKTIDGVDYPNMKNYCCKACMDTEDDRLDKPSIWHRLDKVLCSDVVKAATNCIWKMATFFVVLYVCMTSEGGFPLIGNWSLFLLLMIWIYPDLRHMIRIIFRLDKYEWEDE